MPMKNLCKAFLAYIIIAVSTLGSTSVAPAQAAMGFLVSQSFSGGFLYCYYQIPGYSHYGVLRLPLGSFCPPTHNF